MEPNEPRRIIGGPLHGQLTTKTRTSFSVMVPGPHLTWFQAVYVMKRAMIRGRLVRYYALTF